MEGIADGDDTDSVEPILAAFGSVCNDTMLLYFMPYFIYLFMQYRQQIGIPSGYGIRQSDMFIYLIYQVCTFRISYSLTYSIPIADIFDYIPTHCGHPDPLSSRAVSRMEGVRVSSVFPVPFLTTGNPLERYGRFPRRVYRPRDAKARSNVLLIAVLHDVNGSDHRYHLCDDGIRMLVAICLFPIHWWRYWVITCSRHTNLLTYSLTHPGFIFLTAYMCGAYLLIEFIFFQGAVLFGLWRIKHENTSWHIVQQDEGIVHPLSSLSTKP